MEDKQTKSAIIIQRRFRKYVARKSEIAEERRGRPSNSHFRNTQSNIPNSKADDWMEEAQRQINEIYGKLGTFYNTLPSNFDRAKHLNNIQAGVDETIRNFRNVSSIQDSQKVLRPHVSEEARKRHDEALRKVNAKWWENL